MATATAERRSRTMTTATAAPEEVSEVGEDGYPVRRWTVDGEAVAFSLRPFEPHERTVYWNPQGAGAPMWWRSQEMNEERHKPIIQRESWIDGKFSPRNAWEEHMTVEWLRSLTGGNPEKWRGYNHPDNEPGQPPHHLRCQCSWLCGNWQAFKQHQAQTGHTGSISE